MPAAPADSTAPATRKVPARIPAPAKVRLNQPAPAHPVRDFLWLVSVIALCAGLFLGSVIQAQPWRHVFQVMFAAAGIYLMISRRCPRGTGQKGSKS